MAEHAGEEQLVERIDALMRRHKTPAKPEGDVPVLTDIIDDAEVASPAQDGQAGFEALALELERAVLERLAPELERLLQDAARSMQAEVNASVEHLVREAVAAALARALKAPEGE